MRSIRLLLIVGVLAGCSRHSSPTGPGSPPPTRAEIWAAIQPQAQRYRVEPAFVYALVAAESNFDPAARNDSARGLLQLKPAAWRTVSRGPYEPAVWDWRVNLEVGIDYLAYARSYLHKKNAFSYPLLLASFHYGLDYVEDHHFDIHRIPVPDNPVYHLLWAGNLAPVPLP